MLASYEYLRKPVNDNKHIVANLMSFKLDAWLPYKLTIYLKTYGVIGSFLCVLWPTVLKIPSFTESTNLTKSEIQGFLTQAILWAQLIEYNASLIELEDLFESDKWIKYRDTCSSEAGIEIMLWDTHHLDHLLKEFL